jgi:pimeloyl-ACP methyl ester carboxylesterase
MSCQYLEHNGTRLAYHTLSAARPGQPVVMFLGGYRSDMTGTKALYLEQQCRERGQAFVRFDYSGHGESGGKFEDGSLSRWKGDARAILDRVAPAEPVVLAGSSMGGWISLLLARDCPELIAGIVGIAASADFTRRKAEQMTEAQKDEMAAHGFILVPNNYSPEPYLITKALLDDGEQHCLLEKPYPLPMPVRLVQGMKDDAVPWQTAYRIKNAIGSNAKVLLSEQGDHRLSRPEDLALIGAQVAALSDLRHQEYHLRL